MYVLAQSVHQNETVRAIPTVFKWGLLAAAALLAVVIIEAVRRNGTRDRLVQRAAQVAGLQYNDGDPAGIGSIRFQAFAYAKRTQVSNVVTVKQHALIARAFDYQSYDEIKRRGGRGNTMGDLAFGVGWMSDDGLDAWDGVEQTTRVFGKTRSGAFVKVNAFLPPMSVLPANLFTRALEQVADDIDFESEEFNKHYDVRCTDKRFAWLFLDAQMIDFMLHFEGKMAFETFGNHVLCYGKMVVPDELPKLAQRMATVPALMNPLVFSEYPTVDGLESRDALSSWSARPNGQGGYF